MSDDNATLWTVTVPARCRWMTSNKGNARSVGGRMAIAHLTRQWRFNAYSAASLAKLPTGLAHVRMEFEARFRGKAPVRDRFNLYPTIKAVVDGLGPSRITQRTPYAVGWGLIPDDDDQHLTMGDIRIGPKMPTMLYGDHGHLLVTITDLSDGAR